MWEPEQAERALVLLQRGLRPLEVSKRLGIPATHRLATWQQSLVERLPGGLVKGLIESDGCRIVTDDRGLMSTRYHFSNRSEDIKEVFCSALDNLGIPWTRPCEQQIAIYRKTAVARLDEFVGPKS